MPDIDIRSQEAIRLLRTITMQGVNEVDLRLVLIDSVQGIGGRFEDLVSFLESINLLVRKSGRIIATINSTEITNELLISKIFSSKHIADDFVFFCQSVKLIPNEHNDVHVNQSRISLEFVWFIRLLRELEVLIEVRKPIYRLNTRWFDEFMAFIQSGSFHVKKSIVISPEQYAINLEKNLENGLAAEKFVIKFEKSRLAGHPLIDKIEHVSRENTAAGFDILSFDSVEDLSPNRMIEVKSWIDEKIFYLTANEFNVATKGKQNYCIYLVDRKKMYSSGYCPEVIQNPVKKLFQEESSWVIEPNDWKIEQLDSF